MTLHSVLENAERVGVECSHRKINSYVRKYVRQGTVFNLSIMLDDKCIQLLSCVCACLSVCMCMSVHGAQVHRQLALAHR